MLANEKVERRQRAGKDTNAMTYDLNYCTECSNSPCVCGTTSDNLAETDHPSARTPGSTASSVVRGRTWDCHCLMTNLSQAYFCADCGEPRPDICDETLDQRLKDAELGLYLRMRLGELNSVAVVKRLSVEHLL